MVLVLAFCSSAARCALVLTRRVAGLFVRSCYGYGYGLQIDSDRSRTTRPIGYLSLTVQARFLSNLILE